ncbi:hopanoid biosynthesis-associated RND transporter HpnN [Afipia massiliensis]|uniref:Hopanoid biosynthesis-associated RND transporter HpnN n=1 Tax=Afipia massiliensis TaxID=211460 RepID=A0A4U6BXX9_9BRAD|nr:hopanoid biosynthesis-associated RND transporter HpnN [Afipia massiliensis]
MVSLVRFCTRHAWLVLLAGVALAAVAGVYSHRNFAINTDVATLISPNLDWRKREIDFEKAFPGRNDSILAVVEAPTPELSRQAAAALEKKLLPQTDRFIWIRRPGGGPFFDNNGLLFLPTPEVAKQVGQLASAAPIFDILVDDPSLRGLTGVLEFGLAGSQRGQYSRDSMAGPLNLVAATVEKVAANQPAAFSWKELSSNEALTEADKRTLLMMRPVLDFKALEPGGAATEAIRKAAQDANLAGEYNARVRLTGPVPIANDEFATVQEGALVTHTGTVLIVLFILWLALKSSKIIGAVFITLVIGLSITTAVGLMLVGAFNLISIAFFVLFVGLGVDFGIQYSVRYRAERHEKDELSPALEKAAEYSAIPLTLAAVATAAGFLSFLPTDYKGVSELGKIAGAGMLIAFVAAITVLPALLKIFNPPGEAEPLGFKFLAPVDSFLERHRVGVVAATLGVAVLGLPLLYFLQFDFNPMNLRSAKVESVATYLDLRRDPNTGTNAVEVLAPSVAAAKEIQARLAKIPEVSRTVSLDSFIPDDQPAKLAIIRKAAASLNPILNETSRGTAPSDEENVAALKGSVDSLRKTAGDDKGPGAVAARRLADALAKLAQADKATRDKAEATFISPLNVALDQVRGLLKAQPVSAKTLPPDILADWTSSDGRTRVEAQPKGDPNDNDTLRSFAAAVLKVEPTAIGGPISILKSGDTIVSAFIQAGGWALLSIAILLWIVLKRIGDVLLTLVPLVLAGVVTLEICVLIGLPMNFANIIALPLLLGIGVAFKIYYVTAWRAGQTDLLQSSLTRAIFFSALTTATAFGSLWLSSHPGTSSMGKLLALSLVTTLAAAVLFQPALMGRPRDTNEER